MIKRVILEQSERSQKLLPEFSFAIERVVQRSSRKLPETVIDLSQTDSDLFPPARVTNFLTEDIGLLVKRLLPRPKTLVAFQAAVADWFFRRYDVRLNPEREVLPTLGNRAAIFGLMLAYIDTKDRVVCPDPGFNFYRLATMAAGGTLAYTPLLERNDFLPNFSALLGEVKQPAKLVILNYPNNPCGAVADNNFFASAIKCASDQNFLVVNDAIYNELGYDSYQPLSLLAEFKALKVAVELHSFSFTYGLSRIPLGFAVGNRDVLATLNSLFHTMGTVPDETALQIGLRALENYQTTADYLRSTFAERRQIVLSELAQLNWKAKKPLAGPFIWIKVPQRYSSTGLVRRLLRRAGVLLTPGIYFGEHGESYMRLSLCRSSAELLQAFQRIEKIWKTKSPKLREQKGNLRIKS